MLKKGDFTLFYMYFITYICSTQFTNDEKKKPVLLPVFSWNIFSNFSWYKKESNFSSTIAFLFQANKIFFNRRIPSVAEALKKFSPFAKLFSKCGSITKISQLSGTNCTKLAAG